MPETWSGEEWLAIHRSSPLLLYDVHSIQMTDLIDMHRLGNVRNLDLVTAANVKSITLCADSVHIEWLLEIIGSNRDLDAVVSFGDRLGVEHQVYAFLSELRLHVRDSKLSCLKNCIKLVIMATSQFQRELTI